jgi:adenylate kinase family enzyme
MASNRTSNSLTVDRRSSRRGDTTEMASNRMTNELKRISFDRVNVVGTSGSGKSTVSKLLAAKLGYPRVEMDQLFWEPNWRQPTDDVFFQKLELALTQPQWILDGNYDRTLNIKWKDVTAVIWIDYSLARTIRQAATRAISRSLHGRELWPGTGNRESFRKSFFSRDSILIWTLETFHKIRERYESRMSDPIYAHIHFVRLRSPKETRSFLNSLEPQ